MGKPPAATAAPAGKARRRTGRVLGLSLGVLTAAVGILYGVAWAAAGDKVPQGTVVQGIDLTGLSPEQARERLESELSARAAAGITLADGGRSVQLTPQEAGLGIDYEATMKRVGGRTFNPADIWRTLFGGGEVAIAVDIDEAKLRAALEAAAPTFASEAKPAAVAYDGIEVVRTESSPQSALKVEETIAVVKEGWQNLHGSVVPALEKTEPSITTADADAIIESYAKPAVSGPVEAVTGHGTVTITPQMIAGATTFSEEGGELVPKTSPEKLLELMKPAIDELKLPEAKDASFTFTGGRPTIVPSSDGLGFSAETISSAILPLITKTTERKAEVELSKTPPSFTTDDAEKLGIKEVTGEFTTYFPDTAYRNNNLPKAAAALNGTVIKPGETFSFNKVVGQRTAARGYMAGGAICGGNKICQQLGGGVSQVATTTYNAFFFSGLKHITHQPHTLYFDRYPAGREATIDWGRIDVSFHNDSPYGVYIQGIGVPGSRGNKGSVTIRVWSTKEYDVKSSALVRSNYTGYRTVVSTAADCKAQSGQGGFDVNYKRLWYKGGKLVKEEPYFWRYGSADQIICQ
ncbi:MAG: VanW family protein [Propionibacteriaceae bacterium]|nr:VanW family protein [Propionibacteriaceae bacterium]